SRVSDQKDVGFLERTEAADRRTIEAEPVLEDVFPQLGHRNRKVLPEAGEIDEAQIDDPDALLLGHLENVFAGHRGTPSPLKSVESNEGLRLMSHGAARIP